MSRRTRSKKLRPEVKIYRRIVMEGEGQPEETKPGEACASPGKSAPKGNRKRTSEVAGRTDFLRPGSSRREGREAPPSCHPEPRRHDLTPTR